VSCCSLFALKRRVREQGTFKKAKASECRGCCSPFAAHGQLSLTLTLSLTLHSHSHSLSVCLSLSRSLSLSHLFDTHWEGDSSPCGSGPRTSNGGKDRGITATQRAGASRPRRPETKGCGRISWENPCSDAFPSTKVPTHSFILVIVKHLCSTFRSPETVFKMDLLGGGLIFKAHGLWFTQLYARE